MNYYTFIDVADAREEEQFLNLSGVQKKTNTLIAVSVVEME